MFDVLLERSKSDTTVPVRGPAVERSVDDGPTLIRGDMNFMKLQWHANLLSPVGTFPLMKPEIRMIRFASICDSDLATFQ
jgi:hypothetical protein